jgi:DNA mismatch endonuclease (patch repair protein)
MVDVLTPEQRSFNMSRIRGRDTKPELLLRSGLHARGFRFRLHRRDLPGRPDLVLPRYQTAVFVHGCFWHKHGCALSKMPATRAEFWQRKIEATVTRDRLAVADLLAAGWRVLIIWECALRGPTCLERQAMLDVICHFVRSQRPLLEVCGRLNTARRVPGRAPACRPQTGP